MNVSLVDRNVELGNTNGALGKINVALSDIIGAQVVLLEQYVI